MVDLPLRAGVFLDRDGVITVEKGHVTSPTEIQVIPGAGEAIRRLNAAAIPVIVVTNQSGVARGLLSLSTLEEIHQAMRTQLAKDSAAVEAIFFCPHHPEGAVAEFRAVCECRKPGAEMLRRGAQIYGIDLASSFMVGDTESDIAAGKAVGSTTFLVHSAATGAIEAVNADYQCSSLDSAVETILTLTR